MSPLPSLPSVLSELIKSPEGFIAYTGAGISIAAPSCAPNWWSLTQEIMKAFFEKCDKEWLPQDFDTAGGIQRQPEIMFENFGTMLGTDFYEVFKCLDFGEPNDTHKVIALLAKAGVLKACYTTNFDIYIERALDEAGVEYDRLIENQEYENYDPSILFDKSKKSKFLLCKIHGTVDQPDSIVSTSSVYRSSKGFAPPKARILNYFLERVPCLYLGYSGWDYEHENYMKYWEHIGPKVKAIYWNKRPGEVGGPNFSEIFSTLKNPIQFCEADLPDGLVASISLIINGAINHAVASPDAWDELKGKRHGFFEEWAGKLSRVKLMGLVMTDMLMFTSRLKKTADSWKDDLQDENQTDRGQMSDFMANYSTTIMALSTKLSSGEITMEEYMEKSSDLSMDMMLINLPPKSRELMKDLIKKNAYPGITDNPAKKTGFIAQLPQMIKRFSGDFEKAVDAYMFIEKHLVAAAALPLPESSMENHIWTSIGGLIHEEDALWKPFLQEMLAVKAQAMEKKITGDEFTAKVQMITKRGNDALSGINFDFDKMFQLQREEIERLFVAGDYEGATKATEGFVLTCLMISRHDTFPLYRCKEYSKISFHETIAEESLQDFDQFLRNRQGKLAELAQDSPKGNYAKTLLDVLFLEEWIGVTKDARTPNFEKLETTHPKYQENTYSNSEGLYMKKGKNVEIYAFVTKKLSKLLEEAWSLLPPNILQKMCGSLVVLSEMGNDFELCKKATLESLKASDGVVNQQTPEEIPISYAAFCEERGELDIALKYYELALDAIKFSSPPPLADIPLYRAALLTKQVNKDNERVIRILGKYHTRYTNVAAAHKLPARRLALELGEQTAKEMGYADLDQAVAAVLGA